MRVTLYAVGRLKSGPERDLTARYVDRFKKAGAAIGLDFNRIVELPESRASNAAVRKREEADALTRQLPLDRTLVALDERGKALDSQAFAATLARWRDDGQRDICIVIGGADGLDPEFVAQAHATICFGKMTWPHQLVRIMVAEQLYRAVTILTGHPYHRN